MKNSDDAQFCEKCGAPLKKVENKAVGSTKTYVMGAAIGIVVLAIVITISWVFYGIYQEKQFKTNLENGQRYLEKMDYQKAEAYYLKAIKIDSKAIDVYQGLANTYRGMEEYDKALEIYDQGIGVVRENQEKSKEMSQSEKDFYMDTIQFYQEQDKNEEASDLMDEITNMAGDKETQTALEDMKKKFMYQEYYDLLTEYREKYGEGKIETVGQYDFYLNGVCYAKLLDFNDDGQEELVLAHISDDFKSGKSVYPQYQIEVWGIEKNIAVQLYSGKPYSSNGDRGVLKIALVDGMYYIVEGNIGSVKKCYVWGMQENTGKFEMQKKLEAKYSGTANYSIDDQSVTEEEYSKEISKWEANIATLELFMSKEGEQQTLSVYQDTIKFLENELGINKSEESAVQSDQNEQDENTSEKQEEDAEAWKQAYIEYIQQHSQGDSTACKLLYINDDEIPELLIEYGSTAGGADICTYFQGQVNTQHVYTYSLVYMERKNLIEERGGHMDIYYDTVYRINERGEFEKMYHGEFGADDNSKIQVDENGIPIYKYYWEDEEVSEEEYNNRLSEVFMRDKGADPYQDMYGVSEMINVLS